MTGGRIVESFEKGTKTREGVINIIDLHGTWREMGRQYGALMASEMKHIYEKGIIEKLVNECGMDIENLKDRASKFYANYPSGSRKSYADVGAHPVFPMEQLQLVNAVELIAATALTLPQCTGIAAWGDYVSETSRNYDYLPVQGVQQRHRIGLLLTILPTDHLRLRRWDMPGKYMSSTA